MSLTCVCLSLYISLLTVREDRVRDRIERETVRERKTERVRDRALTPPRSFLFSLDINPPLVFAF